MRRAAPAAAAVAVVLLDASPATAASSAAASAWHDAAGKPAATRNGTQPEIRPRRFRALTLDRAALAGVLDDAPRERTRAARTAPPAVSLPDPDGGFERFAIQRTSVMEPRLAARHPEIATYAGTGIDVPGATVRLDLTSLGFHAAVRGPEGAWYVDPYYHADQSLYVSYRRSDLVANPHDGLVEREPAGREPLRLQPRSDGPLVSLRTYRLALVSDPAYASWFGAGNVTAAKATLVNRVNQLFEDDLAIHLSLVAGNDALNLDTDAAMTGPDGPCGAAPCYTATEAAECGSETLAKTRIVIGQLVGASSYDIGHIGMGVAGGGLAFVGGVGTSFKAAGCTGVSTPVGDLFAVDYVAHEMGHQFDADHTFNGVAGSCAGNRGAPAVEPGSGSSVMAYAGICAGDDLQPHSDPYFSQRSIDQVHGYVGASLPATNEVQTVSLRDFGGADSFRLTFGGAQSPVIANGVNYTASGVAAAIKAIPALAAATVTVSAWGSSSGAPGPTGFTVTFSGSLAGTDVAALTLTSPVGMSGFVGETTQGGPVRNGGTIAATTNHQPVVDAPAAVTIPARTPFALTGSGTDADGDTLTYLWEQNDAGSGTSLLSNARTSGPLFRVFGTVAAVTPEGTLESPSPGENAVGTDPVRVFPDLAQVVAGNTNAATGSCPAGTAAAQLDCYSELLPTSAYGSSLHFRLTARDGHVDAGGVAHDDTTLTLARSAGPFRVTSQASATTVEAGAPLAVTWSVAGTNAAPVSAANVRITMSTDGGATFPKVVAASTPNDGARVVYLPNADTTRARLKVEAVGNVFFDVNRADFTVLPGAPEAANDAPAAGATAQYSDPLSLTVSATDSNSPGSALTATTTGLPAGLGLVVTSTSAGGRTWSLSGAVAGAPGTYPVEARVDDGAGHFGFTRFEIVVAPEDGLATYAGDTRLTAAPGAPAATASLRFIVRDDAAVAGGSDATPGDVADATVSFYDGATALCAEVPVVTTGDRAAGTASCAATLAAAATHHIVGVLGGRYAGSGAGDVRVDAAPPPAPSPEPAPAPPPPPPAAASLRPDLTRVATRLRLSATGRLAPTLRCATVGGGTPPSTCKGTVRLTATVRGRRRTIASGSFSFPRRATRRVSIKATATARRAIARSTPATLTATVRNAPAPSRTARKAVRVLPATAAMAAATCTRHDDRLSLQDNRTAWRIPSINASPMEVRSCR